MKKKKIICKKCILDSTMPYVKINKNGLCSECDRFGRGKSKDKRIHEDTQLKYFMAMIKDAKRITKERKQKYNALVLFSGGKDSSYLLYLAKRVFKLNPLAFTCVNPLFGKVARKNVKIITEKLGVDSLKVKVPENIYRKFMEQGLKYAVTKDSFLGINFGCGLCNYFIYALAVKSAVDRKIPLILGGHDIQQYPTTMIITKKDHDFWKYLNSENELFLRICGNKYKNTIFDFNSLKYDDKDFPIFVCPLTFKKYYNLKKTKSVLNNLTKGEYVADPLKTNCRVWPVFAYLGYKYFGCSDKVKAAARSVRRNKGKLTQFGITNRESMLRWADERKKLNAFFGSHEITEKNKKKFFTKFPDLKNKNRKLEVWKMVRQGIDYFRIKENKL